MDARININIVGNDLVVSVEQADRSRVQRAAYSTSLLRPFTQLGGEPWLTELFEFALGYYTADRIVKRSVNWSREFEITFPVLRLEAWSRASQPLSELLEWTTGDVVHVVPSKRDNRQIHSDDRSQPFMLQSQIPNGVGLMSDGLDSLCGVCNVLDNCTDNYAFLSVLTNPGRNYRIQHIQSQLRSQFGDRLAFHEVDLHLKKPPKYQEQTQRSRTILAIVAGLTVAAGYGSCDLDIYENGFGLLNPPVPNVQVPHESSQVLNPAHRHLWYAVARDLLGDISIKYVKRWSTKSEMCLQLPEYAQPLISHTSSCDSPSRTSAVIDCGTCGSCVLRRIAITTANLTQHDVPYREYRPKHRAYDAATVLRYHAGKLLEAVNELDPWPALVRLQPTIGPSVSSEKDSTARTHAVDSTLDLIRRQARDILSWGNMRNAA